MSNPRDLRALFEGDPLLVCVAFIAVGLMVFGWLAALQTAKASRNNDHRAKQREIVLIVAVTVLSMIASFVAFSARATLQRQAQVVQMHEEAESHTARP